MPYLTVSTLPLLVLYCNFDTGTPLSHGKTICSPTVTFLQPLPLINTLPIRHALGAVFSGIHISPRFIAVPSGLTSVYSASRRSSKRLVTT